MMHIEYDEEADAAYLYLKEIEDGEVKRTKELDDGVNFDFDQDDKLLGIEILDASRIMAKDVLSPPPR